MRVSFHMSLGTVDEKELSVDCSNCLIQYSKISKQTGQKRRFWPSLPAGPPWQLHLHTGGTAIMGWFWFGELLLSLMRQQKFFPKKRKMAAVSATSCGWSKLSRDQNNGFNITSTLCPPACLLPPFLPCAVAEVICLLGTEKHRSRPGLKVWDLRDPSLEQLSSILGCHPRLSSFQVYQFLFAKRDYRTKLTTAELRQFGLETELILIERGKKPHPPKLLKNSFKTIKIMRIINITFQ